jgi:hypothetical protein
VTVTIDCPIPAPAEGADEVINTEVAMVFDCTKPAKRTSPRTKDRPIVGILK